MNEQKLKLILKQLTTLANLQAEKNKTYDMGIRRVKILKEMSDIQNETILKFSENLNERIKTIENENLTKSKRGRK